MSTEFMEVCPTAYHQVVANPGHVWGWEIVVYLFLGGMVAGLMILSAVLELRGHRRPDTVALQLMPFIALAAISLGMGALFLDLHNKLHVLRFYLAFRPTSPMSWGAWILIVIYPAALLMGLGSLSQALRARVGAWPVLGTSPVKAILAWAFRLADDKRQTILWLNVVMGAGLGVYTGLLLGTMVARIQWNSAVLGPLFLASGLSSGAAFMLLFKMSREEQHALVRYDVLAIAAELFFIGLMVISFAGGNAASQIAADNLLGGKWTAPFWSVVVILGLLVPLAMELVELRRGLRMALVTPVLILVGGLSLRGVLLESGQESCFCKMSTISQSAPGATEVNHGS